MNRIIGLVAVLAALSMSAVAFASPSPATGGSNAKGCSTSGKALVNVHYTLINDYDSAVGGNAWANDTINRQLQIFAVGTGSYCAVVTDQGSFVTFAGASPQGTGTVGYGITGKIKGGYTTSPFTGRFNAGTLPTSGNLGTFDLQCTNAYTCPGAHPSFLSYFDGPDSIAWSQPTWAWSYTTAKNGTWLNAYTGNTGDITGYVPLKVNYEADNGAAWALSSTSLSLTNTSAGYEDAGVVADIGPASLFGGITVTGTGPLVDNIWIGNGSEAYTPGLHPFATDPPNFSYGFNNPDGTFYMTNGPYAGQNLTVAQITADFAGFEAYAWAGVTSNGTDTVTGHVASVNGAPVPSNNLLLNSTTASATS
jgi:hypothetical protein